MSLSCCVTVKTPNPILPCPTDQHNPPKAKLWTACAHAPTQPPTYPKTMTIVAAEDYCISAWASDSTAYVCKILAKMVWRRRYNLRKSLQRIITSIWADHHSHHLGVGDILPIFTSIWGGQKQTRILAASLRCWGGITKGLRWGQAVLLTPPPLQ